MATLTGQTIAGEQIGAGEVSGTGAASQEFDPHILPSRGPLSVLAQHFVSRIRHGSIFRREYTAIKDAYVPIGTDGWNLVPKFDRDASVEDRTRAYFNLFVLASVLAAGDWMHDREAILRYYPSHALFPVDLFGVPKEKKDGWRRGVWTDKQHVWLVAAGEHISDHLLIQRLVSPAGQAIRQEHQGACMIQVREAFGDDKTSYFVQVEEPYKDGDGKTAKRYTCYVVFDGVPILVPVSPPYGIEDVRRKLHILRYIARDTQHVHLSEWYRAFPQPVLSGEALARWYWEERFGTKLADLLVEEIERRPLFTSISKNSAVCAEIVHDAIFLVGSCIAAGDFRSIEGAAKKFDEMAAHLQRYFADMNKVYELSDLREVITRVVYIFFNTARA